MLEHQKYSFRKNYNEKIDNFSGSTYQEHRHSFIFLTSSNQFELLWNANNIDMLIQKILNHCNSYFGSNLITITYNTQLNTLSFQ